MKKIIAIFILMLMVGCSATQPVQKTLEVIPVFEIRPVDMKEVNWVILDKDDMRELAEVMGDNVLFVLDAKNNDNLVHNIAEMRRYMLSQDEVAKYFVDTMNRNIDQ